MPRVKRGSNRRDRRKKILKLAKGFRGTKSKLYRSAMESVDRALSYAYRDRRTRKRDFRRLWIIRIGAGAVELAFGASLHGEPEGVSYKWERKQSRIAGLPNVFARRQAAKSNAATPMPVT